MVTRKRLSTRFLPGVDPAAAIGELLGGTEGFAQDAALAQCDRERLAIVVEELASNAARHGADGATIELTLELRAVGTGVDIRIEDDGAAFDPSRRGIFTGPHPETGGGVGLELVGAWCDMIAYAREGDRNRLDLRMARTRA